MERRDSPISYYLQKVNVHSVSRNESLSEAEMDSLFHVSRSAGFVRVSPSIVQRGEGSYRLTINLRDSLESDMIYSSVS